MPAMHTEPRGGGWKANAMQWMNSEICTQFLNDFFPFAEPVHQFLQPPEKATCPMVGKIHANPLSSASPRGVPSSYCCMGTATYAVSSKESMVLVRHKWRSLPRHQWTPKRRLPSGGKWGVALLNVAAPTGGGSAVEPVWNPQLRARRKNSGLQLQQSESSSARTAHCLGAELSCCHLHCHHGGWDPPVLWLAFPGGCSQMECAGTGFESTLRNSNLLLPHSV